MVISKNVTLNGNTIEFTTPVEGSMTEHVDMICKELEDETSSAKLALLEKMYGLEKNCIIKRIENYLMGVINVNN